jgi:GAF domain-containing protein
VKPFTDRQVELVHTFADQAVIAIENARLFDEVQARTKELTESLEQQTATSEVLKVISSSPGELDPVFEVMLENATRICESKFANLLLCDGSAFRVAATYGAPEGWAEFRRRDPVIRLTDHDPLGRVVSTKRLVHIADTRSEPAYISREAQFVPLVEVAGARTLLIVPMLKESQLVGTLGIYRQEVRPFTEKQIELVTNFAAQAVIAIENTRLLTELRESLEQQTATSEVLKVISTSSGELEPVFEAMLENATRICESKFGSLLLYDGSAFRFAAIFGAVEGWAEFRRQTVVHPRGDDVFGRLVATKQVQHVTDVRNESSYIRRDPGVVPLVEVAGARTLLTVPMLKEGTLVGAITIYRQEVRPFSDKQIDLVHNFASQAVIAIENARLLKELRERTADLTESLEQQTATSEVLQVISSSPGELQPVFEAMLENATRICEAEFSNLFLYEDGAFREVSNVGTLGCFQEFLRRGPVSPNRGTGLAQVIRTKQTAHIKDIRELEAYATGDPLVLAGVESGIRTLLVVPMLKENDLVGVMGIYRKEVRSFTSNQIELVSNFAKQAVIAIENTRLLTELRESLQQQTATADVLKVISRSTFDLQTVLYTLVTSAANLCEAESAFIFQLLDDAYRLAASHGFSAEYADFMRRNPIVPGRPGTLVGRVTAQGRVVQISDAATDPDYTWTESQRRGGFRTMLGIPLLREGVPIGVIALTRSVVRPFTGKQIELLTTFADQAVIAIENVRLFDEVQARTKELTESLEQQTATSEVLQVISSSQGELQPVFEVMLERATRVCEAAFGSMLLYEGDAFRRVAIHNAPSAFAEFNKATPLVRIQGNPTLTRLVETKQPIHVADLAIAHSPDEPIVRYGGARTFLVVPMVKGNELIGVIGVYRQEVRLFTDKQIELVQNFAKQALIAIENARLLNELRARTTDLARSVEELRALGAVSQAVNSTLDLTTVLHTIVAKAVQLSGTEAGTIYEFDDQQQELLMRSTYGMDDTAIAALRGHVGIGEPTIDQAVKEREPVQISDLQVIPPTPARIIATRAGYRSLLVVPLLGRDHVVGALVVRRKARGAFPQTTVDLLKTFAAQSVLAIQNAHLFTEIDEKSP